MLLNELFVELEDNWEGVIFSIFYFLAALALPIVLSISTVNDIDPWYSISSRLIPTPNKPNPILNKLTKQLLPTECLLINILLHNPKDLIDHRLLTNFRKCISILL